MANKKVIQLDDRVPKLKAQRRQKANRRFIFYFTAFFLLIVVVIYLVSPISNVRTIIVKGNHHIATHDIELAGHISEKSKIWDINETEAASDIEKMPMIKKATVISHFPAQVAINVIEYRRVAYLKSNNAYLPILENGTHLTKEKGKILPTDAPVIMGFSDKDNILQKLAYQLTEISPAMVHAISEIMPAPKKDDSGYILLYMNNGQLVLADVDTLAKKMKLYPDIAAFLSKDKKGKGIIDLTLGASWTPYPQENKESAPSGEE